ncbi:KAP family P-loop NTPase fold protein [Cohnella silvisoli]|uniref:P-loop NTPase fold protein n=1 Tax=Cohnella silvisoli TaxID=2873699 RepID=A0ABV1KS49_9BACL|nr:P-loop NTPase fold protein [Cohnella silvisoli]MCD9022635.1 KAP family NTPase [Cohnella silvisoli]
MGKLKMKKYFIKDASVNGIDDDLFNYSDISKVIERILDSNEPPYNIAIIGKWGLGKSSLINLVRNRLRGGGSYLFQEINAWKYEKESLRRVFLKQLWQGISGEKLKSFHEIQRTFSDLINNTVSPTNVGVKTKWWVTVGKTFRKYGLPILGLVLFTAVGFTCYKLIQAHTNNVTVNSLFWWKVILSYGKNISTTLLLPVLIALLTALHSEYRKKEPKKFEFNFPLETADDYELFLENSIADKLKNNPDLKIVTVIDDLDRLGLDKIVEALDSIKAFVNLPNCVFVVPFDDEIIKSALEKRRETQFGEDCDVIESELILDKLFQFKVYLPPLLKYDIKQYTMNLVKREIPDFIADNCPEETFDRLVSRILIHSDVTTPRQVKKLINAFVNNYLIAREREESGRVEKGLLTGERGIEQIAKLSVLQADFNHFYDLLFKDFSYVTRFVEIVQNQNAQTDVPADLQGYYRFIKDGNKNTVDSVLPIYEPLLNFLISRAKYSVDNIAPFLYLAQDAISIKTGDEQQRRTIAALESGNESTLRTMLGEKPEIAEAVISYISECAATELPLQAAYPIVSFVDDVYTTPLANILIERSIESDTDATEFSLSLSPDNVLYVAQQAERDEYGMALIEKYLSAIADEKSVNEQVITNALKTFIPEYRFLSSNAQDLIKHATNICCLKDKISVNSILPLLDYSDSSLFATLWGVDWFSKLCTHITDENDYKVDVVETLKKSFNTLTSIADYSAIINCVIPLFKLPPLLEILNDMFSVELCSKFDESLSTDIVNELIVHKYDKNSKNIHKLLSKLRYIVDDENAEAMTEFTENYATSALMDDVLVYLGKSGYFPKINATLSKLVIDVFTDENNDELLGKISNYLTEDVRAELFNQLGARTQYGASEDYVRELAVISVLASDDSYKANFENLAVNTLLSQTNNNQNYYCHYVYFEFVAQAIGSIKSFLQQQLIDGYVDKLINLFPSQRAKCLYAFERLTGVLSKERFAKVFPLLTTNIPDSEFDQALKILMDNDNVRPTGATERTVYRKFLTSHLEKSANPNMVLQTLKNSFSYFSDMKELTVFALNNSATDRNLLIDVMAKCFNGYEDADKVSNEALPLFDIEEEFTVLKEVFAKLTKHSFDDVFTALSEKLDTATSIDTLVNIVDYAKKYNSTQSTALYVKTLNLSLEHDNVPDKVVKIISTLSVLDRSMRNTVKDEFITSLHSGFTQTTSESILNSIVSTVMKLRWTKPFKKLLKENEEKLKLFDELAK